MGLHAQNMNNCSMEHMSSMNHDNMEHGDMHHHETPSHAPDMANVCDFGFACMCSIKEAPVKTEIPVVHNPAQQVEVIIVQYELDNDEENISHASEQYQEIIIQDYGPPLFVLNQSFLN